MSNPVWQSGFYRQQEEFTLWFRVFGHGLHITNAPPVFSERYGHTKILRIFGVRIKCLTRPA